MGYLPQLLRYRCGLVATLSFSFSTFSPPTFSYTTFSAFPSPFSSSTFSSNTTESVLALWGSQDPTDKTSDASKQNNYIVHLCYEPLGITICCCVQSTDTKIQKPHSNQIQMIQKIGESKRMTARRFLGFPNYFALLWGRALTRLLGHVGRLVEDNAAKPSPVVTRPTAGQPRFFGVYNIDTWCHDNTIQCRCNADAMQMQ